LMPTSTMCFRAGSSLESIAPLLMLPFTRHLAGRHVILAALKMRD